MDRTPEQLKLLGVFGIYKEAYKITVSWRKIFSQITLAFILPLSILHLSEILIPIIIHTKTFRRNETSRWIAFGIFEVIYILLILLFSLLSTSVVSYTIACIYTPNKEITFKKIISVVPKVWKRLIVTTLWSLFFIIILYSGVAVGIGFGIAVAVIGDGENPNVAAFWVLEAILALFYFIGLVYLFVVWNLASVTSVLENIYGFQALKTSRNLIKGKFWVAYAIFAVFGICFLGLLVALTVLILLGDSVAIVGKVFLGICCYLLMTILIHFLLLTQTIIYFVCKWYHNENIDRPAEHLEASYANLNGVKDVQLEKVPV